MERWMMESKKEKCHLMRIERERRKRRDRDPNPEVEGHTADVQDREAESGQEVEEGHTVEGGGLTAEEGVRMTGGHLGGDHLPRIIGLITFSIT